MQEFTLITGGAGYIGSFTAREILQNGGNVLIVDSLSTGHREVIEYLQGRFGRERVAFEESDLANFEALSGISKKYRIRNIVDFAARSLVGESQHKPRLYFENNVLGFLNLLLAFPDKPLVKSSTAATYGEPSAKDIPIKESYLEDVIRGRHPPVGALRGAGVSLDTFTVWYREEVEARAPWMALTDEDFGYLRIPTNIYGLSKVMNERMLHKRLREWGTPYLSLRYFNAAGADKNGEMGEDHDPETHLIPLVMKVAIGLEPELEIYGGDYPTRDGTCIRDYISVKDLAAAHGMGIEYLSRGGESELLNLGQSLGYSVQEILQEARRITGCQIPARLASRRPGDPAILVADPSRAREILGWKSTESLEDIIFQAWAWHKSHPHGYRQGREQFKSILTNMS